MLGVVLFLAVTVAGWVGATAAAITAAVLLIAAAAVLLCFRRKAQAAVTVMVAVAVGFVLFSAHYILSVTPVKRLDGVTATVSGRVSEMPDYSGSGYSYKVSCSELDGTATDRQFYFRLQSGSDLGLEYGDSFTAKVRFFSVKDIESYAHEGSYIYAYVLRGSLADFKVTGHTDDWYSQVIGLRKSMQRAISENLSGDTAALVGGVTIGNTAGMSDGLYSAMKVCGMSHMAVVSGTHLSVIVHLLLLLLQPLGKRRSALVCIPAVLFMVALMGFTPSIIRSGVTMTIYLLGLAVARRSDGVSSLGAAIIIMLLINPFYALSLSFILSVFATAGILLISPHLLPLFSKWPPMCKIIYTPMCLTVSAQIMTVHVGLVYFGNLSLVAVLVNVLLFGPLSLIVTLGMLGQLLSFWPFACRILMVIVGFLADICNGLMLAVAQWSFASTSIVGELILLSAAAVFITVAVVLLCRRSSTRRWVTAVAAVIVFAAAIGGMFVESTAVRLTAVDTDKGMSVIVSYRKHAVIIGTGGDSYEASSVAYVAELLGVSSVDMLIITDGERDIGAAATLIELTNPQLVVSDYNITLADGLNFDIIKLEDSEFTVWNIARISIKEGHSISVQTYGVTHSVMLGDGTAKGASVAYSRHGALAAGADNAVICREDDGMSEAAICSAAGTDACYTGGDGSITVTVYRSGNYSFRRERDGTDN